MCNGFQVSCDAYFACYIAPSMTLISTLAFIVAMLSCTVMKFFMLLFAPIVLSHSWVEQLSNIASDGSYTRYGYPRGFVDKGRDSNFDQSTNMWLLPPSGQIPNVINSSNLLCHPSQRTPIQAPGFPRLQALAGGMVAMRYAENGHVTIPGGGKGLVGKPAKGGTVFVFGTRHPHAEEKIFDVLRWTRDGSGGDQRGLLLTAQNFDDGRCYQLKDEVALASVRKAQTPNPVVGQPGSEHELLCETDVQLPEDAHVGSPYTLYWVWQWPTTSRTDYQGNDEYYTSCVDVDMVLSTQSYYADPLLGQQDPMPTAVPDFRARSALTLDPLALSSAGFGSKPDSPQFAAATQTVASPNR